MENELAQKAIAAAMKCDWQEAERLNLLIIKKNPKDTEALNRLGRAYLEQGKKTKAQKTFQKVLKLNPYNNIAQKNLMLLKTFKKEGKTKIFLSPELLIEEPGRTKTVTLTKTAEKKTLSALSAGEEISLKPRKHSLVCYSAKGIYLGKIPDDLSLRLLRLIRGGNQYQAFIKAVNFPQVKVFLREAKRAKRLVDIPSFPTKRNLSYTQ